MRPIALCAVIALFAGLLLLGAVAAQEKPEHGAAAGMPAPSARLEQHIWLDQLVGEWTVKMEASMGPGAEPMQMESTESVRSIGGVWIVAEGKAEIGGMPMTTMMTLGYDPAKKTFVGTWIDTMHIHLWVYTGALDDGKRVLTLSAEGPDMEDPTKTRRYRDAIEIVAPDHKVLTSSMQNADGTWTQFSRADYRRKE